MLMKRAFAAPNVLVAKKKTLWKLACRLTGSLDNNPNIIWIAGCDLPVKTDL